MLLHFFVAASFACFPILLQVWQRRRYAAWGKVGNHAGMGRSMPAGGGPAPEPERRKLVAAGLGPTYARRATVRIA